MLALNLFALSFERRHKLLVVLEKFKLYSNKLYTDMTKSKSSVPSIVVPSIFVIHLLNDAQFLNATSVPLSSTIAISSLHLLLKCKHRCDFED